MAISFDEKSKRFHLTAGDSSYVMEIVEGGFLAHLYWGKRIRRATFCRPPERVDRPFSPNPPGFGRDFSLDTLPQEYPAYGRTDFRAPAYQVRLENGSTVTDLRYCGHRISHGKPKLPGLPATYVERDDEAETLEIELTDPVCGLKAVLFYTAFSRLNAFARSVRFVNEGREPLVLLRAMSASVDFRDAGFDWLHLSGTWANERQIVRRPLAPGGQSVESRRGASSHQHNPFIALLRQNTDEDAGEVYGFSLVYSGNFWAGVEVDPYDCARVLIGLNPFDFAWRLDPGESFQTPEAVLVYSDEGLGGMSRTYHWLYRSRLCRGPWRDRERPILVNNWEATYFDFDEDKLVRLAEKAADLGIELFVLDDGWFGQRDDDTRSLGDWYPNPRKLPNGLSGLAGRIAALGLRFGIWVEPEMVSEDSDLYRRHPDWCLHVPGRGRSTGRSQLVLDLSREDVREYVVRAISDLLSSAPIDYVKWDMNRHMTEIGSAALGPERQRETAHRYMLGLYAVLEELTVRFPHVLFESCSGGGGRFDPGMLYYMPQTWTSDNTDAVCRVKIQYGTSLVYPAVAMGAHVSAVPNHQVGRTTPLRTRGDVACSGNLGYELDLTALSDEACAEIRRQTSFYRDIRRLVQFGDLYRLISPFSGDGNEAAWMYVSEDRSESVVFYFRFLARPNPPRPAIRLKGLDPLADYLVREIPNGRAEPVFGGDELMHAGLPVPERALFGDFQSAVWLLFRQN